MYKNVASQKFIVYAYYDGGGATPGAAVTGDAANITAKISKDGGVATATNDTNPTEIEDGYYAFDAIQAETNADKILVLPQSSTANVVVIGVPALIDTKPNYFSSLGISSGGVQDAQVKGVDDDAITAASIATDAITGDKFAASAVLKIWSQLTSGLTAIAGSFGKLLIDTLDEAISTRSTFDHTTHEVTTDSASRTASQATGFATPTHVSDAQTAIINAVNAVNTGAARYISIATSAGYELPDSGTAVYPVEVRTFDGDGNPVALDAAANPTITVTRTADAADLSANLSAISNPATGVYRCTFTVTTGTDVVGPLQIDATGAIATVTRSTSSYPVITDATAVDFTATDRANLAAILEDTGTTLPGLIATAQDDLDILTGSDGATLSTASTTAIGTAFLSTALSKGTAGTIERAFWQILKTQAVTDGTAVADASNTTTTFYTNLTAANGVYDHMIILFTSNGLEGEARPIDTYVQTNGVITLQEPLTSAPTGDEEFIILPQHAHPISEIQEGLATSANQNTIINNIAALPAAVWAIATNTLTTAGTIGKLIVDQFTAVLSAISGIEGGEGSGANAITITVTDADSNPLETISVRRTKGADTRSRTTNASGQTTFNLDAGTWTLSASEGVVYYLSGASGTGVTYDSESQTAEVVVAGTGSQSVTLVMTAIGLSVPDSPRIRARLLVLDKTTKEGKSGVELQVTVTDAAFADGYASEANTITVTSDANGLAEWYALPGESYKITGENVSSTVTVPKTATDPHSVKSVLV